MVLLRGKFAGARETNPRVDGERCCNAAALFDRRRMSQLSDHELSLATEDRSAKTS
jgi:hypothetical protein